MKDNFWDRKMNEALLNLPWQMQVAVASGGAAYLLSYRGMRSEHNNFDIAFITLIFSLIASAVLYLLPVFANDSGVHWVGFPFLVGLIAFAFSCLAAVVWRKYLRDPLHKKMREHDVSWSNDDPSAFATLVRNNKIPITQIAVELDNGTWLRCDEAYKFADAPFGPALLGPNGDIALYLTHEERLGEDAKELKTVRYDGFGDLITYIPAARVRQITLRYLKTRS